jgi:hypothetical protein
MGYLLTRPIAIAWKLLVTIVTAPYRMVMARRNHKMRKDIKVAAAAARQQPPR